MMKTSTPTQLVQHRELYCIAGTPLDKRVKHHGLNKQQKAGHHTKKNQASNPCIELKVSLTHLQNLNKKQRRILIELKMQQKNSFTYKDLIECAKGKLFGEGNAKLPHPPMLMMDRIIKITKDGGNYNKGEIIAELDIKPNLWFFDCHFKNDPVMPGCLGLDALWQLVGFFFRMVRSSG